MWEIKPFTRFPSLYTKGRHLGGGGFGQVYAGRRIYDNLPVAIKEIDAEKVPEWAPWKSAWANASGEQLAEQVVPLEIVMALRVHDLPGVIGVLDVFDVHDHSIYVMVLERPKNSIDLYDLISRKRLLDEATSRMFFIQVRMWT